MVDVDVQVVDALDPSHAPSVEARFEPVVRCLAMTSRLGAVTRARVELRAGPDGVRWDYTLVFKKREVRDAGDTRVSTAEGLRDILAGKWLASRACGDGLDWSVAATSPPPRPHDHGLLWDSSGPEPYRIPAHVWSARAWRDYGVFGAGESGLAAAEVVGCSCDYGADTGGVGTVYVTVYPTVLHTVVTYRDDHELVFDRPWTGERSDLLRAIDAALSGPFVTVAECVPADR
jgi:hypothetical protein